MTHDEWLNLRRTGIGGSDIAAICGIDPYRGPLDVYLEKLALVEPSVETEAMSWGRKHEPLLAAEVTERTGIEWTRGRFMRHVDPRFPVVLGTPDYLTHDETRVLECKTAGLRMAHLWGDEQTDAVPMQYLTQVLWYLELSMANEAKLAVLIGGNEFRLYTIRRDEEAQAALVDRAMRFWRDHVGPQTPPPLVASDAARAYLRAKYPRHTAEQLAIADPETSNLIIDCAGAKRTYEEAEARYDTLQLRLCDKIGDGAGLVTDGYKVTWKASKDGERVDWRGVAEETYKYYEHQRNPDGKLPPLRVMRELIEPFTTIQPGARRFLLKEMNHD